MILTDDRTAVMEPRDFSELPEYSCSIPTGTTIGKRWKRDAHAYTHMLRSQEEQRLALSGPQWWMAEYTPHEDPTLVGIFWRQILIVE